MAEWCGQGSDTRNVLYVNWNQLDKFGWNIVMGAKCAYMYLYNGVVKGYMYYLVVEALMIV